MNRMLFLPVVIAVLSGVPVSRLGGRDGALGDREKIDPLKVGETVADFALRDLAGRRHRLADYGARKAIVLAFNGLGCPIAELYAGRLERLHRRYSEKGVQFLGINSNLHDRVEDLRGFASGFGLTFPILKDHEHRVADLLGARRTTEVFLLDATRTLRYRGRIDDQYTLTRRSMGIRKDHPETLYLENAIDAVLSGKDVARSSTEPAGCVISRRRVVRDPSSITFHRHVEPIIQKRCQSCHRKGDIGPFPLRTYEDVTGWSGMIREVVVNRRMPPWHADPEYGKFSNDRSLSEKELATLVGWIDNGTPAGDPRQRPPPRTFPEGWTMGTPDAVFEIPEPFSVPATGAVPYKYAVVQTDFPEDRWVVASEVRPGNRSVVHHILVFAVDPRDPKRWRRETGGGARGYYAVMVPGERPTTYPQGMAKRLPAGATLIFQIHYTPDGTATEDRSRVGFIFTDESIHHEVHTRSAFNQSGLIIPPGADRHEITASYRISRSIKLLSFLPHMHLRGESFRYELHHPVTVEVSRAPEWKSIPPEFIRRLGYEASRGELTWTGEMPDEVYRALGNVYTAGKDRRALEQLRERGRSEILLNVPRYDFNWQNTYRLATPKPVRGGALLTCTAHYNNSAFNPALTREMYTRTVRWGNQTWEEMLIGYFDFIDAKQSF